MLRTTSGVNLVVHHHQEEQDRERERDKKKKKKKEDGGGWVPFKDLWDHPFNSYDSSASSGLIQWKTAFEIDEGMPMIPFRLRPPSCSPHRIFGKN